MANKKIKRWVFPQPYEIHTVKRFFIDEHGLLGCTLLRNCLHGVNELGGTVKILYCSRDGHFFVRKKDGCNELQPKTNYLRRKLAGKPLPAGRGGNLDSPQMIHFDQQYCHKLVAFAWCERPHSVMVDGMPHNCSMDFERGRMYYWDILLDAHNNLVRDENGDVSFIKVYLQIDHLNTNHADYCADNLEYITAPENRRRRGIANDLRKAGLDVKKMPYKLLRNFFRHDGMLVKRIEWTKRLFGDMYNL